MEKKAEILTLRQFHQLCSEKAFTNLVEVMRWMSPRNLIQRISKYCNTHEAFLWDSCDQEETGLRATNENHMKLDDSVVLTFVLPFYSPDKIHINTEKT